MDEKKKVGRPKTQINYKLAESLSSIFCTEEEIATILETSVRTLQRDEEFCRVFKKGRETAKMSLRRKQFDLAGKNPAMAIFLGKQYLGQRDTVEVSHQSNGVLTDMIEALNEYKKNR